MQSDDPLCTDTYLVWSIVHVVHTGEEHEETVYQVRGKLYALSPQNQWKERGTGTLKLNVRKDDGSGARLSWSSLPHFGVVQSRADCDSTQSCGKRPSTPSY